MKYKTVIWDFNGTLFDDMGVSIDAMNTVLSRRSLPLIKGLFEFQNVFGFPVRDYYSRIGLDFSKEPYEVPAPRSNYAGDRYEELAEAFIAFVRERKPKLASLAELKVDEINLTEAAKELDKAISTVDSQTKKLEELVTEFLDNAIIF